MLTSLKLNWQFGMVNDDLAVNCPDAKRSVNVTLLAVLPDKKQHIGKSIRIVASPLFPSSCKNNTDENIKILLSTPY